MTPFQIDIEDSTGRVPAEALRWLNVKVHAAAQRLGLSGQVHIRAVDHAQMGRLHEAWFGDPSTTDVITLDLLGGERRALPQPTAEQIRSGFVWGTIPVDADVAVCVDEAARQVAGRGYPLERELLLYVVHALMHCLGWDDESEGEAAAMHRAEDALLEAIGVGPVFDPGEGQEGVK